MNQKENQGVSNTAARVHFPALWVCFLILLISTTLLSLNRFGDRPKLYILVYGILVVFPFLWRSLDSSPPFPADSMSRSWQIGFFTFAASLALYLHFYPFWEGIFGPLPMRGFSLHTP